MKMLIDDCLTRLQKSERDLNNLNVYLKYDFNIFLFNNDLSYLKRQVMSKFIQTQFKKFNFFTFNFNFLKIWFLKFECHLENWTIHA